MYPPTLEEDVAPDGNPPTEGMYPPTLEEDVAPDGNPPAPEEVFPTVDVPDGNPPTLEDDAPLENPPTLEDDAPLENPPTLEDDAPLENPPAPVEVFPTVDVPDGNPPVEGMYPPAGILETDGPPGTFTPIDEDEYETIPDLLDDDMLDVAGVAFIKFSIFGNKEKGVVYTVGGAVTILGPVGLK